MFIVIEGLDGCGKTTQAQLIKEWLTSEGKKTYLTAEPSKNRIGLFIREVLAGTEKVDPRTLALLFTADRAEHLAREVKPALARGEIVVMERYMHSTIAYQTAQGVNKDWIAKINDFALKPELTLFLDLKPGIAAERTDSGEIFENKDFQEKVYREYLDLEDMVILDADKSREEVFKDIKAQIKPLLEE